MLKSDIEIAPVYHRLPDRIRAHAQICYLALVLHRVMRMRLNASGSAFTFGTTSLATSGVTDTYFDLTMAPETL